MATQESTERKAIILRCRDCRQEFPFTPGEQEFYASRVPPLSEPRHCPLCRKWRRFERKCRENGEALP